MEQLIALQGAPDHKIERHRQDHCDDAVCQRRSDFCRKDSQRRDKFHAHQQVFYKSLARVQHDIGELSACSREEIQLHILRVSSAEPRNLAAQESHQEFKAERKRGIGDILRIEQIEKERSYARRKAAKDSSPSLGSSCWA